jgi:TPP-dependent pyruvate/acetoin dehydrogenase alpha subunit
MSNVSDTPATGILEDLELYTGIYRQMLLIRGFEDLVQSLFLAGEVYGTTHLYSGQEAIATGVASLLEDRDRVAATYRGHGHALALGVDPQALLDEMLGRATGINGGRAGSMNVNSPRDRLIGSFGIVGGSIAAATGAALGLKKTTGGVAVAYFGDGATNHGYFHECLNFAAVNALPVLFVCENNLYGEFTPWEDVTAGRILERARGYGIDAEQVDGMDVFAVRDAARIAVANARSGDGPAFLEALTYRFVGHSRSDPATYRKPGELDRWKARDPLIVAAAALQERFDVGADAIAAVDAEVDAQMELASERALAAPYPEPAGAYAEFGS